MRLIDADALIHKFNYADGDTEDERVWCATMRRMIKEQPTAYDIDKVVEEIEVNGKCVGIDCPVKYCWDCEESVISIKKAIEIVKEQLKENK